MDKKNRKISLTGIFITIGIVIAMFICIPTMIVTKNYFKGFKGFINNKILRRGSDINE